MRNWSDQAIWGLIFALVFAVFLTTATVSYGLGVKDTIKESQRSAVVAGAARWSSNRETGEAQFDYIQCLNPGVK